MTRSNIYIHYIATAVPEQSLPTATAAERLQDSCINERSVKLLRRLSRHTRIDKRHMAAMDYQLTLDDANGPFQPASAQPNGPGMTQRSAMFLEASDRLVRQVVGRIPERALGEVNTLITATCTDAASPGLERPVFEHARLTPDVERWNLGFMGCSAALAALRLGHRVREPQRVTLALTCELSSLHYQYTDQLDQMAANLLFADGSAAALMSSQPAAVRIIDCRCAHVPDHADQMVWTAGDHGLRLSLSPQLSDTLGRHLPAALATMLHDNGYGPADIKHWLVHPGGPQILDGVEHALNLPPGALQLSRDVLFEFGNMSSATILFILERLLETRATGPAVAIAFGPGLTIEMVLLNIDR